MFFAKPLFVQFLTKDSKNLPVLSFELLTLHTICCKVAYMSSTTKYIEKFYEDADTMSILAFDSTFSDILSLKLMSLVLVDIQE